MFCHLPPNFVQRHHVLIFRHFLLNLEALVRHLLLYLRSFSSAWSLFIVPMLEMNKQGKELYAKGEKYVA